MIGIERTEIAELNSIDLIKYLLETDEVNFRNRNNGTIVYKVKDNIVIWKDHSYTFGTTLHPYKDNIGTLREIYGYSFMEAVEKLRAYRDRTQTQENDMPRYTMFD